MTDELGDTSKFAKIADKLTNTSSQSQHHLFDDRRISEQYNLMSKIRMTDDRRRAVSLIKKEKQDGLSSSLIQREKKRDAQLKRKLDEFNLKQAQRLQELQEADKRLKDAEVQRVLDRVRIDKGQRTVPLSPRSVNQTDDYKKAVNQLLDVSDLRPKETSEKNYFNKINQRSFAAESQNTRSDSNTKKIQLPVDMSTSTLLHSQSQRTLPNLAASVNWGTRANRTRQDISFLKEQPSLPQLSRRAVETLASQSHITTGEQSKDNYFKVALGIRSIGRSILDLPRTIADLKTLSGQYQRSLHVTDPVEDEQIYLQFIEQHYLATEKNEKSLSRKSVSPIKNLQEYYSKMLNKLDIQDGTLPLRRRLHQQSVLDLQTMSAEQLIKMDKSPPKLSPTRKRLRLINTALMSQFGKEAFRLDRKIPMTGRSSPIQTTRVQDETDRSKLIKVLADQASQLVQSSISPSDSEFASASKDLGKPSARQDALLLAKWFHDIIEVIESESIQSELRRQKFSDQNQGRLFATQKTFVDETNSQDAFHYVQLAHNIAIKELTRQVSVQCVERGILLKTIFDSYLRLTDLLFCENLSLRRNIAAKFATVFESQLKMHENDLQRQQQIVQQKDELIDSLKKQLVEEAKIQEGQKVHIKKIAKMAARNQGLWDQEQKERVAAERQVRFLEERVSAMQAKTDPVRIEIMQKEMRRQLMRIQRETLQTYQASQALDGGALQEQMREEMYELQKGDVVTEANKATDMHEFVEHLERCNGGPIKIDIYAEAKEETASVQLSPMNFKELGLLHDGTTCIDEDWRKATRLRPGAKAKTREVIGILPPDDAAFSDNTSTRSGLHYRFRQIRSKSFANRIVLNKKILPVLKRRPHSQYANNEVRLVANEIQRLKKERQNRIKFAINQEPMLKLRCMLGESLLTHIEDSNALLFKIIIDNAKKSQTVTPAFCREVITEVVHQANTTKKGIKNDMKLPKKQVAQTTMKQINIAKISPDTSPQAAKTESAFKPSKIKIKTDRNSNFRQNKTTTIQEYKFSKPRSKEPAPVVQQSTEHQAGVITGKLLKKQSQDKKPDEVWPVKTLLRTINVLYAQRIAEATGKKKAETKRSSSKSPMKSPDAANESKQIDLSNRTGLLRPEKQNADISLSEWVYDYMQHRYGLQHVTDKKFAQLVNSTLAYRDKSHRIYMFGRFMGLYDNLIAKDFKLYIETQETVSRLVLNFQIQEGDEVIQVPLNRALDHIKLTFGQKMTVTSLNNCFKILRNSATSVRKSDESKYLHLSNVKESVSLDIIADLVISTVSQLQAEKLTNIKELFLATDLDANGIISFDEFKTLYKLIQVEDTTDLAKKLFDEFSDLHDDGVKPQRGINLEAFRKICLDRDVFSIKAQNAFLNQQAKAFMNVTEPTSAFAGDFYQVQSNLQEICESLGSIVTQQLGPSLSGKERMRYLEMIDQMAKCVMSPVNQKIGYLTVKIVTETIKRAVLKHEMDDLLPVQADKLKLLTSQLAEGGVARSQKANNMLNQPGQSLVFKAKASIGSSEFNTNELPSSEPIERFLNIRVQTNQSSISAGTMLKTVQTANDNKI